MALTGTLDVFGVAELLEALVATGRTGCLSVTGDGGQGRSGYRAAFGPAGDGYFRRPAIRRNPSGVDCRFLQRRQIPLDEGPTVQA